MVIPKPLCQCAVCREAREKGVPYSRAGPSAFLHDIHLLIDTPAEIIQLLNRSDIRRLDYLMFTHLDPDHIEGFRVVEQIALDFRSWRAYPQKQICLLLPQKLNQGIRRIQSQFGPMVDFYRDSGFIDIRTFEGKIQIEDVQITAIPVDHGSQWSYIYIFVSSGRKVVYAPCDIKPFPENRSEVQNTDLLIIQPGIFEGGLKHGFKYPSDHISRTTLYTYEQTLELTHRINAKKVIFVHLEEYWNRGYDDYCALETSEPNSRFAHDGMQLDV